MTTTDFTDDVRTQFRSADPPSTDRAGNRTARVAWLALGGLLAVASLFWGTMNVIGVLAHGEYQEDFSFAADDVRAVDIRSEDGSITVIAEPVETVTVTADVSDGLFATDVDAEVVSGVLEIRGDCPALSSVWCEVDFTVSVPADRPITVDASNGSVLVRGFASRLDVDNDNGSIDLDGVSGQVRASNDNGRIVGTRLTSGIVDASTSNGRIELAFAEPPTTVTGRTDNGSIEVTVPDEDVLYRVDLSTDNGSRDNAVRTDPASDRLIDLTADNGSVTVRPAT
ncbi:DUF4097 family beta strand repeat-containing protein [Ilumatobacter nonamiensis]|uniref:DUF4097 family beta strand repeat-containing protein n=1 Tax=Ilumatobacter nonamiensis TaxID=467093 RepID=UPI00130DAC90|nr:DUF4097 family beta strand repeat-containing protein [Ilumatobacter nonamiensis]